MTISEMIEESKIRELQAVSHLGPPPMFGGMKYITARISKDAAYKVVWQLEEWEQIGPRGVPLIPDSDDYIARPDPPWEERHVINLSYGVLSFSSRVGFLRITPIIEWGMIVGQKEGI